MDIVIRIPNSYIPKHQGIVDISLSFVDGKVTDAHGYGFCQLPECHGRLIDADALECEPYLVSKGNGMYEEVKGYFNIDDALTILEATE